ncbi:MAG: GTPase [Candidatus Sumerlaeota bacterium]|nr:GTPase [Candidatus Sumerlaeota bacterium]
MQGHFVDFVRVHARAGNGGHGCISFLRLKGQPHAGPDGGDGGRGGSVILEGDSDLVTLIDFKMRHHLHAENGANGGGKNCSGKSGKDIVARVPLGTVAVDADTGEELGEVTAEGQRLVVVKGGDGGLGNQHYATSTNKTPRKALDGWPGEERNIILELKVIADVGLVGLPNAGKSTLLRAMTDANPKIASYPFTTVAPNLGVFLSDDFKRRVTLADIPGLIEGAHTGAGLGHRFLRHIERTRVIVHLVAPDGGQTDDGSPVLADANPESLVYAFELVRNELEDYSPELLRKPYIVCLNKTDLMTPSDVDDAVKAFHKASGYTPLPVSADTGEGLDELKRRIESLVFAGEDNDTGGDGQ